MGRPVNPNVPEDGYVSQRQFNETGSIAAADFAVVGNQNNSKKLVLDPNSQPNGTTYTLKSPAISGDVTLTLPTASGTLVTTATESNSFSIIQPDVGTSPTADSSSDTLTLTSSDGSVIITGDSSTDTVDFVSNQGLKIATFRDQKAASTDGGTFTSGAWQVRDITNIDQGPVTTGVTLSSNQLTFPAGTYYLRAALPAFNIPNRHMARLYDTTGSVSVINGQSCSSEGSGPFTYAFLEGIFTLSVQSVLEVQHRCQTTVATIGYGRQSAGTLSAAYDIFTSGTIIRLA